MKRGFEIHKLPQHIEFPLDADRPHQTMYGIHMYGSLNGVSSTRLISSSTISLIPRSVGPVEIMCFHYPNKSLAY